MTPDASSLLSSLRRHLGGELVGDELRLEVAGRPMVVALGEDRLEVACEALPAGLSVKAEGWISRLMQSVGGPDLQVGIPAVDDALLIDGERDGLLAVLEEGLPERLAALVRWCRLRLEDQRIVARVASEMDAVEVVQLAIDLCVPPADPRQMLRDTAKWSTEPGLRWAAWRRLRGLEPERARRLLPEVMAEVVRSQDSRLIRELMGHVAQAEDPHEITALVQAFPNAGPAWARAVLKLLLTERALGRIVESLPEQEHEQRIATLAALGSMAKEELIPRLQAWAETPLGGEYRTFVEAAIRQIEARASGAGGELALVEDAGHGQLSVAGEAGELALAKAPGDLSEAE